MARRPGHILPFRIPFFRIFYSTTYTTIYIINLCLLVITPGSMIWAAIQSQAYQYVIMIGGTYIFTALIAIFIYASRLYTNRTVLAGVGKAYIPVEDGEVGKRVRKMIVKQLEKSAIVAWESRPRDLLREILRAESQGFLPAETASVGHNDYTVGREITIDPARPPWGNIEHPGWSSPSHTDENINPNLQFATVIAELPNLIEARAVSLAPPDESVVPANGPPMADPVIADVLRRPETMGMREYLAQLSYLGLVDSLDAGQSFLLQYEKARFGGRPVTEAEFRSTMASFAEIMGGMLELRQDIIDEIRRQTADNTSLISLEDEEVELLDNSALDNEVIRTPISSLASPVTACTTAPSRSITPYMHHDTGSEGSLGSVLHQPQPNVRSGSDADSSSLSDSGSVV
jgi:hypothetical protein